MFALTLICLAFVCQVSAFDELSNKQHERIRRYSYYDHDFWLYVCGGFEACFGQYQALMTPSGDQPTDFCAVGKKAEVCFSKQYQICHNMPDNEIQAVKSAVTVYCSARKNCAGLTKCSDQVQLSVMNGTVTVKDHCELLQKIDQCFEEDKECHVTPAPSLTADVDSVCKLLRK